MRFEKGDFVFVQDPDMKKPVMAEVLELNKKTKGIEVVLCLPQRAVEGDQQWKFEVRPSEVVANLGKKPNAGKVFGVDSEPYLGTIKTRFRRKAAKMAELTETEEKQILHAISLLHKRAKYFGLEAGLRDWNVHIKPATGRKQGMWSLNKEGQETLSLYVGNQNALPWAHVTLHEFGHHIWNRYFDETKKSEWIGLYNRAIQVSEVSASVANRIRVDLERAGSIKLLRSDLREQEEVERLEDLKWVLRHSQKLHNLSPKDYDVLLAGKVSLKDYWVTVPVPRSEVGLIVSDYARKNPQEFFCEAVAFTLTKSEIPKSVRNRVMRDLKDLEAPIYP